MPKASNIIPKTELVGLTNFSNGLEKYGYTLEPAPGFKNEDLDHLLQEKYGKLEFQSNDQKIEKVLEFILDPETHLYLKYKGL